jgi:photosystem II stability/assembly factor-like uncharacterized protein
MITPNPPNTNGSTYSGSLYVYDTSGGFSLDQTLPQINLNNMSPVTQYDVTDAVQIYFSVRTLNDKIGIYKDASNNKVVELLFDLSTDNLLVDSINITTTDFLQNVNVPSMLSLGSLSTLYTDFDTTVKTYFGDPYGFSTFFAAEDYFVNGGIFDASAFVGIVNGFTFNIAGSFVSDLAGEVTINDLNNHLRYITATNAFNNRPSSDNYDITEGFVAGDLIFIPNGIKITLSVDIQPEGYVNINNMGPGNLSIIDSSINYSNNNTSVSKTTTYSITNITQSYNVPILLVLTNKDYYTLSNFGNNWKKIVFNQGIKWLAISMSANGQYQTAIEEFGDIYVSSDLGQNWTIKYNIGNATSNCVAMSQTGQYQTASNGHSIYISNNFGNTWLEVFSLGTTNIFVSISLNGQYQTIVSCGDNVYQSSNYGLTWTSLQDTTSDLYNSINIFPTVGCAMTFTGKMQVIASENIYISNDYGVTWNGIFSSFDDRNWDSIAMSSDGKYLTALDSGGDIYRSDDYGQTWNYINETNVIDNLWQAIAMSAGGQFQTALEKGGSIYSSTDYGVTWSMSSDTNVIGKDWQCVAISANGVYQSSAEYNGSIYVSTLI